MQLVLSARQMMDAMVAAAWRLQQLGQLNENADWVSHWLLPAICSIKGAK